MGRIGHARQRNLALLFHHIGGLRLQDRIGIVADQLVGVALAAAQARPVPHRTRAGRRRVEAEPGMDAPIRRRNPGWMRRLACRRSPVTAGRGCLRRRGGCNHCRQSRQQEERPLRAFKPSPVHGRPPGPTLRIYSSVGVLSSTAPGSVRDSTKAMESTKRPGSGEAKSPFAGNTVASNAKSLPLVK
jgi:hypothetical protein